MATPISASQLDLGALPPPKQITLPTPKLQLDDPVKVGPGGIYNKELVTTPLVVTESLKGGGIYRPAQQVKMQVQSDKPLSYSSSSSYETTTTTTTTTKGPTETHIIQFTGPTLGHPHKEVHVLKDTTQMFTVEYKKAMASKAEEVLAGTPTCDSFLEYIATERLRSMPQRGSEWDKILKWAESFCRKVDLYSNAISSFTTHSWESARLVWGSCRLLLQMGQEHEVMLQKVFSILYQMGQTLDFFLTNQKLFSASGEIQDILAYAYSDMVQFTVQATIHYKQSTRISLAEFESRFGSTIDSFFQRKEAFTITAWACTLRSESFTAGSTVTIQVIWQWLAIHDKMLELFLYDRMGTRTKRCDHTCEWFETHFKDFQRGNSNVFWVVGQSGSGKSVLTGWVLERLARTRGLRNSYDVISFSIDGNLKGHRSSLSVVRSLLLQQLGRNVGDLAVYRSLAALYERSERMGVTDNLEKQLWNALDAALGRSSGKLMIVLDGLDHLEGGEPSIWKLIEQLQGIANRHNGVKCLFLSVPLSKPCPTSIRQFTIDATVNSSDITTYIEWQISMIREFKALGGPDRKTIVERVTKNSNGSFMWAHFALQVLKTEKTIAAIMDTLKKLVDLSDLLKRLCSHIKLHQQDTKILLSLILAAERPLSVQELKHLFEIDISNCTQLARLTNLESDLTKAFGSLVVVRDGMVCFSHVAVKAHLLKLATSDDTFDLSIQQAHTELAIRSLAYLKLCLSAGVDEVPTLQPWHRVDEFSGRYTFLEYAVRYYTFHFQNSSMYNPRGPHRYTPQFKACFPASVVLALIERNWWEKQTSAASAVELHSLALQIRKYALGERHRATIQCYFNLAETRRNLSAYAKAGDLYFEVWRILTTVLGDSHHVTRECALAVLTCTDSLTTKTSTTIITRKETIYEYLYHHGSSQMEKIKYGALLAEIYITLGKTKESLDIYREIRKSCIIVYGDLHEETMRITLKLTSILGKLGKHDESLELAGSILAICGKLDPWQEERIITTIHLIEAYEKVGRFGEAEDLLYVLWTSISEVCKSRPEETMYEAKIRIALQYVELRKRRSEQEKAKQLLIQIWNEFKGRLEETDNHRPGFIAQMILVGEQLLELKEYNVACAVFKALRLLFQRTGKSRTTQAINVGIMLSIVEGHRNEPQSQVLILREIFDVAIAEKVIDTIMIINTCIQLANVYEFQQKRADAIEVLTLTLNRVWPELLAYVESNRSSASSDGFWYSVVSYLDTGKSAGGKVNFKLPARSYRECIEIARKLAQCYLHDKRVSESEGIYVYIQSASLTSLNIQDDLILSATHHLIHFYQDLRRIDDALKIYQRLFKEYQEVLGASHNLSITITYELAEFCSEHVPQKAEFYYKIIIDVLGNRTDGTEIRCLQACLALCKIYEREKKHKEALIYYGKAWTLFCRFGHDSNLDEKEVMEIYRKYISLLEREGHHGQIFEVNIQFRDTCIKYYGPQHEYTIIASIELARLYQHRKTEKDLKEALLILEGLRSIFTQNVHLVQVMKGVNMDILKMIADIYSNSPDRLKEAEVIHRENWWSIVNQFGYTSTESLSRLEYLILFQKKHGMVKTATTQLQEIILEVILKERDHRRLYDSGVALAKLYLVLELRETAFAIAREIRIQLNSSEVKKSTKFGFSLRENNPFLDRTPFVFVIAFESTLRGSTHENLFTKIMTDLVTESDLYRSWMEALKWNLSFETSLTVGARLRHFLLIQERRDEVDVVEDELWVLFQRGVGEKEVKKSGIVWELFLVCIQEMGSRGEVTGKLSILDAAATEIFSYYTSGNYSAAFELATWSFNYITNHGGFDDSKNLTVAIKIALWMTGNVGEAKPCSDQKLVALMSTLSTTILTKIFEGSNSHLTFHTMELHQVNLIIDLFGQRKSWKHMERILRDLWNARMHKDWPVKTLVSIGRRLCEVLFVQPEHREEAIILCRAICYNLKRVYGLLNAEAISFHNLLSSFYLASDSYGLAMEVHTDLIQEALNDDEAHPRDTLPIVREQLGHLKTTYQYNQKWIKDVKVYNELWEQLDEHYQEENGWNNVESLTAWSSKLTKVQQDQKVGMWKFPSSWTFTEPKKTNGPKVTPVHVVRRKQVLTL